VSGDANDARLALTRDLDAYVPSDDRESTMRLRLTDFVRTHADCFARTQVAGHVTGSAWIVDRDATATVLVHHRKLDRWLQPGGHADGDPDVRGVALREATEESGLVHLTLASPRIYDLDVHAIPARRDEPAHVHYDIRYAFYAPRGEAPIVSDESHAVAWIAFDEIERYAIDDSVRRLVAKSASLCRPVSGSFRQARRD